MAKQKYRIVHNGKVYNAKPARLKPTAPGTLAPVVVLCVIIFIMAMIECGQRIDAGESLGVGYTPGQQAQLDRLLDRPSPLDRLVDAVEIVESHRNPDAVSPKGARGLFQIMPETARKPGMGVTPLRSHSEAEQRRFARDYLQALLGKYNGNVRLALAAYNAGIHRVDQVMARLPRETREYVKKVEREYAAN